MTLSETSKVDVAASMRDLPNYFGPCLDAESENYVPRAFHRCLPCERYLSSSAEGALVHHNYNRSHEMVHFCIVRVRLSFIEMRSRSETLSYADCRKA